MEVRLSILGSRISYFFNLLIRSMICLSLLGTGCSNLYSAASKKDSDEAYYEEARKAINSSNYSAALDFFALMSAGFRGNITVRRQYATALAGRCGMTFATLYDGLSNANLTGSTIFKYMRDTFIDKSVNPTDCTAAEAEIKAIWTIRAATSEEQLFMMLLSFAKVGTYLRNKSDRDGSNLLGDGITDASFDGCTNTNDNSHLTDTELKEIVTGFSLFLTNFATFSASFSGVSTNVTAINTACAALTPNPCTTSDSTSVSAAMIDQMRDILATGTTYTPAPLGIGSCVPPTLIASCCP